MRLKRAWSKPSKNKNGVEMDKGEAIHPDRYYLPSAMVPRRP